MTWVWIPLSPIYARFGQQISVKPFSRIMSGDLKELYEREVLDAPDGEEREWMISVINTMCGNDEGQFWNKLMSNDKVSFAFESCYDSYLGPRS